MTFPTRDTYLENVLQKKENYPITWDPKLQKDWIAIKYDPKP